jgi:hypothetical protein
VDWLDSNAAGAGGLVLGLAVLLAVLAFIALPRGERYLIRAPALLIGLHVAVRWIERFFTQRQSLDSRLLTFLAIFGLFGSMARSAFLLAVMSEPARRLTRPWPGHFGDQGPAVR